jgi:Ca-activated chloride channel family protein
MEDNELHRLKNIMPPPPSKEARLRTIDAARQAFDISANNKMQKNEKTIQGVAKMMRLIYGSRVLSLFIGHHFMANEKRKKHSSVIKYSTTSLFIHLKKINKKRKCYHQHMENFIMKKQFIAGTALATLTMVTFTTIMWQKEAVVTPTETQEATAQLDAPLAEHKADSGVTESAKPQPQHYAAKAEAAPSAPMMNLAQPAMRRTPPEAAMLSDSYAGASVASMPSQEIAQPYIHDESGDTFEHAVSNPVKKATEEPVSTFSIDVDTASYSFMRRSLLNGHLPPKDAVRTEELINYFDYDYPLPHDAAHPFKPTVAVFPTPWNKDTKLMHIGIKGHDIIPAKKPASNLVFLLDVSGSMESPDKLPLLRNAFAMMVEHLHPDDTVSIVTYAGNAGTVLEPTKVKEKAKILAALEHLQAGGSTAGAQGIQQAYALAQQNVDKEGVNRVILATDGDFNVGITDNEALKSFIERNRESGIFLSVLGFGQGNYNDALMQTLAQHGNGNAAYIDSLNEARKVLVEEASSTLFPIAKDVKIQIEFNPASVAEYRLIGYETRMLQREDFNNDKVDAGDIGSGHTVTALYEITPVGSQAQLVDALRYQKKEDKKPAADANEYAFLKLRYKLPTQKTSRLLDIAIDKTMEKPTLADASEDSRFAASVAAFGQLLRGDTHLGTFSYEDVIALAKGARGEDEFGYRTEFVNLVRLATSARKM